MSIGLYKIYNRKRKYGKLLKEYEQNNEAEYDIVKKILIKHNALHLDIDQIDDTILMQDLYTHFQEEMPYGTQKARDGDPDEYIYDKLEDLGLPLGEQQL